MTRPLSLEDLAARLPAKARLIGVDLGTKTIGLALSDVERRIASPLVTLKRTKFSADADALAAEIKQVRSLCVDRRHAPRARRLGHAARASGARFCAQFRRLASRSRSRSGTSASRPRRSSAISSLSTFRAPRRAEVIDKMAAAYILQGALDALSTHRWTSIFEALPSQHKIVELTLRKSLEKTFDARLKVDWRIVADRGCAAPTAVLCGSVVVSTCDNSESKMEGAGGGVFVH